MKNKLLFIIIIFLCAITISFAQMKKITGSNMYSQADIFEDENGVKYSTIINLKFNQRVMSLEKGLKEATLENVLNPEVKDLFLLIRKKHGNFKLIKEIPSIIWGDVERVNKRTGKKVNIPDLSQKFQMIFNDLVPIDSVINDISKLNITEYLEGPTVVYTTLSPDDHYFVNDEQWEFEYVDAEKAWDITTGSSNITISINDLFGLPNVTEIHEDVDSKVDYHYNPNHCGGHGIITAAVAAAETNNDTGVASLGWNTRLMFHQMGFPSDGPGGDIVDAVARGADIINFSWISTSTRYGDEIEAALQQGVVCVAGAGNDSLNMHAAPPQIRYPAAHNFGNDGQVIAVSATWIAYGPEDFIPGWNYSPGSDPINNPTTSFIDVCAPGGGFRTVHDSLTSDYLPWVSGTSLSAPMVSALVALIFSINNSVDVNEVYEIITETAENVDQDSYPDDANGWNQYTGYGRINAYEALKYTLENFGGTLSNTLTIPSGETWNFEEGVTVRFESGEGIVVNGSLNVNGTSNDRVTFTSTSGFWDGIKFNSGSSGTIEYCDINNAVNGVYITGAAPIIRHCTIENNQYGIRIYNGTYTASYTTEHIADNTIELNSSYGIYFYNSVPTLSGNTITNNTNNAVALFSCGPSIITDNNINSNSTYGLAIYSSSPRMYYNYLASNGGHNQIENNDGDEIRITGTSTPILGNSTYNGNNSILDDGGYLVYNSTGNSISAEHNWWGSSTGPDASQIYGTVDYVPYLTSDPNTAIKGPRNPGNDFVSTENIDDALSAYFREDYAEAAKLFKEYIVKNPTDPQIIYAVQYYINSLELSGSKSNAINAVSQLKNLNFNNNIHADISGLYAALLERNGNYNEALSELNEGITTKATVENKNQLNLQKAHLLIHSMQNKEAGKEILQQILNEEGKDSYLYEIAYYELESLNSVNGKSSENNLISAMEDDQPVDYKLANNYPNPFNPTTSIKFSIPTQEHVQLEVYDILGRKIADLVNETLDAGTYRFDFDGSHLSSGTYIYRITTNNFVKSKKMLLIK